MSLLNMSHINMKKFSVDYIPKINAANSVEFRGMKNRAKLEGFFYFIIPCVLWEKIEFHLSEIFQTKWIAWNKVIRKIFASSSIL